MQDSLKQSLRGYRVSSWDCSLVVPWFRHLNTQKTCPALLNSFPLHSDVVGMQGSQRLSIWLLFLKNQVNPASVDV